MASYHDRLFFGGSFDSIDSVVSRKIGCWIPDIGTTIDEPEAPPLPAGPRLSYNYPNPFNMSTNIQFELPRRSHVELTIYNVLGQRVAVILDTELPAGHHTVSWDGHDSSDRAVSSGAYFYRITSDGLTDTKKMLLLK